MFGTAEQIAVVIGQVLAEAGPVDVLDVGRAPPVIRADTSLLVVGGELLAQNGIREWLDALAGSASVSAVAFDTRVKQRWCPGSAAQAVQNRLVSKGFVVTVPPRTYYTEGMTGPLLAGELGRARRWGMTLGQ